MKNQLASIVSELRDDRTVESLDEAAIKQAIVLRLLSTLGWNQFRIDEVTPEHAVGGLRVDYALRLSNNKKVFIEVKRGGERLEVHQEQLLSYSFQEGVSLAILTNGTTWWFCLPLREGSWEQRRFLHHRPFSTGPSGHRYPDSPPKIVGMAFVGLQQVWGVNRGVDRTLRGVSERIGNG